MPSGFPVDSRVPVTVFEVPGRKGLTTSMPVQQRIRQLEGQGTGSRADRARAACVPDDGGGVCLEGGFPPSSGRQGRTDAGRFGVRRDRRGMVGRRSRAPAQAAAYRHAGVAAVVRAAGSRVRIRRSGVGSSGGGSGIARSRRGVRGSRGRAGPRRPVSGQARASIAGVERVVHFLVVSYPYSNMRYVAALPGETSGCVCHGLGEVFARVGMAPRVVVSGQRHGLCLFNRK